MPLRVTVWLPPLDAIASVALLAPEAVGLNPTLIVQVLPGITVAVQLLVAVKSPGSVPASAAEVTVRLARPLLFTVKVCAGALALTAVALKVRLLADTPSSAGAFGFTMYAAISAVSVALRFENMAISGTTPWLAAMIAAAQVATEVVHLLFNLMLAVGSGVWHPALAQLLS